MQREKPPEWREKQKGSRGIRRGQRYRLVFQFPIRELKDAGAKQVGETLKINILEHEIPEDPAEIWLGS
ncbi:hypothetical protein LFZ39_11620 [Salmonella enterica subsp. enterica serovar Pullorum]|nr:hypothetical protein LFZ39_11620 [Salmonella enterica subsp. enterica serovar Pullorum]